MDHSQPRKEKGEFYVGEVRVRLKGAESKSQTCICVILMYKQKGNQSGLLLLRTIIGSYSEKSSP